MLYTTGWNKVRIHSTNTNVFSVAFLICSCGPQQLPFKYVVNYNHKGSKFLTWLYGVLWFIFLQYNICVGSNRFNLCNLTHVWDDTTKLLTYPSTLNFLMLSPTCSRHASLTFKDQVNCKDIICMFLLQVMLMFGFHCFDTHRGGSSVVWWKLEKLILLPYISMTRKNHH